MRGTDVCVPIICVYFFSLLIPACNLVVGGRQQDILDLQLMLFGTRQEGRSVILRIDALW